MTKYQDIIPQILQDLSRKEILMFYVLKNYGQKTKATNNEIASIVEQTPETTSRQIAVLINKGYVTVNYTPSQHGTIREITIVERPANESRMD